MDHFNRPFRALVLSSTVVSRFEDFKRLLNTGSIYRIETITTALAAGKSGSLNVISYFSEEPCSLQNELLEQSKVKHLGRTGYIYPVVVHSFKCNSIPLLVIAMPYRRLWSSVMKPVESALENGMGARYGKLQLQECVMKQAIDTGLLPKVQLKRVNFNVEGDGMLGQMAAAGQQLRSSSKFQTLIGFDPDVRLNVVRATVTWDPDDVDIVVDIHGNYRLIVGEDLRVFSSFRKVIEHFVEGGQFKLTQEFPKRRRVTKSQKDDDDSDDLISGE